MKKIISTICTFALTASFFAASNPAKIQNSSKNKSMPEWVTKPSANYKEALYATAVSSGKDDITAEDNARAELIRTLNQKIWATENVKTYADSKDDFSTYTADINSSSEIKNISGLTIAEEYYAPNGTVYALAVLNRQDAADYYGKLISKNDKKIQEYLAFAKENSKDIKSCIFANKAYKLAQDNEYYTDLIAVIGSPFGADTDVSYGSTIELYKKVEAIKKQVPVQINIAGDQKKIAESSFKKNFQKLGIISSFSDSSPYKLFAKIELQNPESPDGKHSFCNYVYTVELISPDKESCFSYSAYGRAGHVSDQGAINKAMLLIAKDIESKCYEKLLNFAEGNE